VQPIRLGKEWLGKEKAGGRDRTGRRLEVRRLVQDWRTVVAGTITISIIVAVTAAIAIIPIAVVITVAGMVAVPALTIIVAPVAGPFAPFAVAAVDDFEVGAAPAVDPNAVAVVAPGTIENAIGFAALADDKDAVAGVNGAEVAVHVVGGAINEAGGTRLPVSGDAEVGATAAVHPDAALAVAPGLALDTSGLAALPNHAHAEAGIGRAPGAPHVIRGAIDNVGFAPATKLVVGSTECTFLAGVAILVGIAIRVMIAVVIISVLDHNGSQNSDFKLRAATVINPDAIFIEAPRIILDAFGLAFLVDHLHAASGVNLADAAMHVIGLTRHSQRLLGDRYRVDWLACEHNSQEKGGIDQEKRQRRIPSQRGMKTDHSDSLQFGTRRHCRHGSVVGR